MVKVGLFALLLGLAGVLTAATLAPSEAIAAKPCQRASFDTKLVEAACKKGGQAEAKDVMKKWVRDAKKRDAKLDCKSCHTKLAPSYDLKPDGLEKFRKLGGK
jgi:hypothetical protein